MIQIHIPKDKQCFFRSQMIWIYTVCKDRVYPGSARPRLSWTDWPKQTVHTQIRCCRTWKSLRGMWLVLTITLKMQNFKRGITLSCFLGVFLSQSGDLLLCPNVCQIAKPQLKYFLVHKEKNDLTHCRLNELPHTIYWEILILILGMSGYVI